MEGRESEPMSAQRRAALRRVLLMRFLPALLVMLGVAAYAWHARAQYVAFWWVVITASVGWAAFTTVKRYRTAPLDELEDSGLAPEKTPWRMLLSGATGYLLYVWADLDKPWVIIVTLAFRIRRVFFDD